MADHPLITSQLQTLASRLPPPLFAEIADGLQETYQAQLIRQPDPHRAAQAAVAQFGDADTITRALCHQAPWRRHAAALLVTGPLLGTIWATTLITQQAWLWSLPWIARGLCSPPRCSSSSCCSPALCWSSTPIDEAGAACCWPRPP